MKRAFLLFAVAILLCNTTLAQEPEPDPNLLWVSDPSWVDGFERFLVHPNGNILAGIGSTEFELDGNTGLIIREFPHPIAVFYDVSPDGKYISALADSNRRCVIDYETAEILKYFTTSSTFPKFMPDNKSLIFHEVVGEGSNYGMKLVKYNIETNTFQYSSNGISRTTAWNLDVSPDGRYVATGGRHRDGVDKDYTHLVLWDSQTLEPLRVLGKIEDFNEIRSIKFSPDSRLVGFVVYIQDLYIYRTDDYSLYKHYGEHNTEYGIGGFCFINEDHIGNKYGPLTYILNLHNGSVVFKTGVHGGTAQSIIEKNQVNNTMITGSGQLIAWDLNKIMTNIIEPEIPNPFTVEYINNTLNIQNYTFGANSIICSITDINGRVIRTMNLNTSTGDIRIPIKLLSGTYFLHIKDGGKEYVDKFLVVE